MILLVGLIGLVVGSLVNWASDRLPAGSRPRLALGRWIGSLATSGGPKPIPGFLGFDVAIELLVALSWAALAWRYGLTWQALWLAVCCAFLALLAAIDLKHRLVLNLMVGPAAVVAVLFFRFSPPGNWLATLVGGGFAFLIFLAVAMIRPGSLGGGDVKLAGLVGLVVGFPTVIWALLLAVTLGGIVVALLLLSKRWTLKSTTPYAPFLCLGGMLALLYDPLPLLLSR
ncbi:MAG: prepilin peptidase [Chloroflexota bacterium]